MIKRFFIAIGNFFKAQMYILLIISLAANAILLLNGLRIEQNIQQAQSQSTKVDSWNIMNNQNINLNIDFLRQAEGKIKYMWVTGKFEYIKAYIDGFNAFAFISFKVIPLGDGQFSLIYPSTDINSKTNHIESTVTNYNITTNYSKQEKKFSLW